MDLYTAILSGLINSGIKNISEEVDARNGPKVIVF